MVSLNCFSIPDVTKKEACTSVKPELSVTSSKVVENAELALTWKGADFVAKKNSAITASATIKF